MTGCLYLSPAIDPAHPELGVIPILLADTLATLQGAPDDWERLKPTTVSVNSDPKFSRTITRRKLVILGPAALALAGDATRIEEALREFRYMLPELNDVERPLRWFGDALNAVNRHANRIVVEGLGAYIIEFENGRGRLNFFSLYPAAQTEGLGVCAAVGSGAEELAEMVCDFDRIWARAHVNQLHYRAAEIALSFCADRLGREIIREVDGSWGGYVEWVYAADGAWHRAPKTLHLFYEITVDWELRQIPRVIAYDPGEKVGRVLSIWGDTSGHVAEFELRDLLDEGGSVTGSLSFWAGWRPEACTVSWIHEGLSPVTCRSLTINPKELEHVRFEFGSEVWGFGIDDELMMKLLAFLDSATGRSAK